MCNILLPPHNVARDPDIKRVNGIVDEYIAEIESLAAQGAEIIIFTKRNFNLNKENDTLVIHRFTSIASHNNTTLIIGYTNFRDTFNRNSAAMIILVIAKLK